MPRMTHARKTPVATTASTDPTRNSLFWPTEAATGAPGGSMALLSARMGQICRTKVSSSHPAGHLRLRRQPTAAAYWHTCGQQVGDNLCHKPIETGSGNRIVLPSGCQRPIGDGVITRKGRGVG